MFVQRILNKTYLCYGTIQSTKEGIKQAYQEQEVVYELLQQQKIFVFKCCCIQHNVKYTTINL